MASAAQLRRLVAALPRTLHRDVKPSNILMAPTAGLSGRRRPRQVRRGGGGAGAVAHVDGEDGGDTGFLDPLFTLTGEQSEVTDAFGIGITILMSLTGLPGLKILQKCRPCGIRTIAAMAGTRRRRTLRSGPMRRPSASRLAVGLAYERDPEDRMARRGN